MTTTVTIGLSQTLGLLLTLTIAATDSVEAT